jgi:cyanate permease
VVLNLGWRQAALLSGVLFLTVVPVLSWFLRETPESMDLYPDGEAPRSTGESKGAASGRLHAPEEDFTPREAFRTHSFWHLALAVGTRQFSKQSLMVHMVPLLVWKGIDEASAALLVGLFAFSQVPMRLGAAYVADRWSMTKVPGLSALAGVGAVAILLFGQQAWLGTGILFALCFALGETGNSPAWAVIGNFFGRTNYATIRGSTGFAQSVISLPAPVVAGWLYDTTQSYTIALIPVATAYLISFLLFWTLRRPIKAPAGALDGDG